MLSDELKEKIDKAALSPDIGGLPDFLLEETLKHTLESGLFMEFGVFQGRTIKKIREFMNLRNISEEIYGFDSFEGSKQLKKNLRKSTDC